jgi:hypothetical protein
LPVPFVGQKPGVQVARARIEGEIVVDYCANPKCMKPLHYLREGTIYIFEVRETDAEVATRSVHHLEHYWLCGECSIAHRLERTPNNELRLVSKPSPLPRRHKSRRYPSAVTHERKGFLRLSGPFKHPAKPKVRSLGIKQGSGGGGWNRTIDLRVMSPSL